VLCRDCEALADPPDGGQGEVERPREEPVSDQLCTRCGHLLGTEATEKKLHRKQSQLERFGLSGHRRPLTKPNGGKGH
jgi:hypothetical protein